MKKIFLGLFILFACVSCEQEESISPETQLQGRWLSCEYRESTHEPDGTMTSSKLEEAYGYAFLELREDGSYLSNFFIQQGRYDFKNNYTQIYFVPSAEDENGNFVVYDSVNICDLKIISSTEIRIRYTFTDSEGYMLKFQLYFKKD